MTTMQALRQKPGRPGAGQPPPTQRRAPDVPGRIAFWLLALVLAVTMLGTTLPTPLYVIYQDRWHFSAAVVTVTFAVYAAVMATLLLAVLSRFTGTFTATATFMILLAALSLFSISRFARVVTPVRGDR